ncbi:MAG TPA: hypothetical protein VFD90_12700 [Gaiellales bacterium]|nr:hypothetical protein [Gaiellales bacterium]
MIRRAVLGLMLALILAPQALADGDPASDILAPADARVYMTLAAPNGDLEKQLTKTTQAVTDAGLPIKVAVIGNKTDLGAVPQLWAKPQTYARFLGSELRFIYKDTLLIVMPQGFGINGPYGQSKALAALSGIDPRKDPTPKGLTASADKALLALAAADGLKVSGGSGGGGGGLPLPLIAAGVMVLAGIGGGVLVLRGDGKPRSERKPREEPNPRAGDTPPEATPPRAGGEPADNGKAGGGNRPRPTSKPGTAPRSRRSRRR